jgi:hypothetical protein
MSVCCSAHLGSLGALVRRRCNVGHQRVGAGQQLTREPVASACSSPLLAHLHRDSTPFTCRAGVVSKLSERLRPAIVGTFSFVPNRTLQSLHAEAIVLPLCERLRQVVLGASCFLMLCYLIYVGCFTGRISLWDAASRKVRLGFAVAGVGVRTSPVFSSNGEDSAVGSGWSR